MRTAIAFFVTLGLGSAAFAQGYYGDEYRGDYYRRDPQASHEYWEAQRRAELDQRMAACGDNHHCRKHVKKEWKHQQRAMHDRYRW